MLVSTSVMSRDEVVIDLAVFDDDDTAAPAAQQRIDHVESETGEPIPMLDQNPAKTRIPQELEKLAPRAVQSRPDL